MRIQKVLAAVAAVGFISSSAIASVLPAPAGHLAIAPTSSIAGARIGAAANGKRSNFAGGGAGVAIVGIAAVGIGVAIADAAGAFKDKDHRPAVSP